MQSIFIQCLNQSSYKPDFRKIRKWTRLVLDRERLKQCEVIIRIVNKKEMTNLNTAFRQQKKPTNVLSFPFYQHKKNASKNCILGDIVICATVVNQEASMQNKPNDAHWAHMIIHGVLHLLGFDHQKNKDAKIMEQIEIELLAKLNFKNPYHI